MLVKSDLSEHYLKAAKLLFQDKLKNSTKAAAFNWLLNFEPYCYHSKKLESYLNESDY